MAMSQRSLFNGARVTALLFLVVELQACGCVSYSNRLCIGHRPEKNLTLEEQLLTTLNKPVTPIGRKLGWLTTPFKRLGIFGWRDMGIDVRATGDVREAVFSTDHFLTVDLQLNELIADGHPVTLEPARYLRAEICERELALPHLLWPCPGDTVRISGRLMWDGDGFLEVHPLKAGDVEILQKANGNGKSCP